MPESDGERVRTKIPTSWNAAAKSIDPRHTRNARYPRLEAPSLWVPVPDLCTFAWLSLDKTRYSGNLVLGRMDIFAGNGSSYLRR